MEPQNCGCCHERHFADRDRNIVGLRRRSAAVVVVRIVVRIVAGVVGIVPDGSIVEFDVF